jgi:mono/diheme cytochrome c family protein
MNLFHAPWLRQPNERAGHYAYGDPRRRSGWRPDRTAAAGRDPLLASSACGECHGPAASASSQRTGTHPR